MKLIKKIFSEEKRIEKLYEKEKHKKSNRIIGLFFILCFCFFFLSNLFMPIHISKEEDTSKIGRKEMFSQNRNYTLISASYSKEQKLLEILIEVENNNYDDIDEYYFVALGKGKSLLKVEEVFNDKQIIALRIENIRRVGEVRLMVAPKIDKIENIREKDTANIILNKYNVRETQKIKSKKGKEEYRSERIDFFIKMQKEQLNEKEEEKEKLEKSIKAMEEEKVRFTDNEKQMTQKEKKQWEDRLISLEKVEEEKAKKLEELKEQIETLKVEINQTNKVKEKVKEQ